MLQETESKWEIGRVERWSFGYVAGNLVSWGVVKCDELSSLVPWKCYLSKEVILGNTIGRIQSTGICWLFPDTQKGDKLTWLQVPMTHLRRCQPSGADPVPTQPWDWCPLKFYVLGASMPHTSPSPALLQAEEKGCKRSSSRKSPLPKGCKTRWSGVP